jgi:hypothetical protein
MRRKLILLPSLLLAMLMGLCHAANAQRTVDDDEADKEWKEIAAQMPEAPKNDNLLAFYDSGTQAFAIDTKSLSVAGDGTIRYTLVSASRSGARNISYEAIRCASFEKKLYAFGRPDGSWSRSRRADWQAISATAANKQHSTLAVDFFCEGNTVAGKADAILGRLKRNQSLRKPY